MKQYDFSERGKANCFSLCCHTHKHLHYVIYFLQRCCMALSKFFQQFLMSLKLCHHACFVVMWIKQLSVSSNELPLDLKTSLTAKVSNRKVFSNASVTSWCYWNIPSLASPNLLLVSLNISHIIGSNTVHFNNVSLLSMTMAQPSIFINLLFYSNVR